MCSGRDRILGQKRFYLLSAHIRCPAHQQRNESGCEDSDSVHSGLNFAILAPVSGSEISLAVSDEMFFSFQCVEARLAASEKATTITSAVPLKGKGHLSKHLRKSGPSVESGPQQRILQNGGGTGWNWEVVLGGTGILTPKQFITNLQHLAENT